MSIDLIVSLVVIGVAALLLHLKSHSKFILLGLFVGIVLAQTAAEPAHQYLAPKADWLARPSALNTLQLISLLVPTLLLGLNHASDKKQLGLAKTVIYSVFTTLLLLSSVLKFLPENLSFAATSRSLIAFQLHQFYVVLLIAGAAVVIIDSFHHKKLGRLKVG